MAQTSSRRLVLSTAALAPLAALPAGATDRIPANPDSELIRLAEELVTSHEETTRLDTEWDARTPRPSFAARDRFMSEVIYPRGDVERDLRHRLATMRAMTIEGFRAKARVVRAINNCADGYACPLDDGAMEWSLANDLLGVPSVWRDDEQQDEGQTPKA
jgi:hypothetical protein